MPRGIAKDKPPKDNNAPKRPQSSYFFFLNKRRPELKAQYNDKKITDIAKMVSAEWKKISESDKKFYDEQAKKAKDEYTILITEYKKTDDYKIHQKKLKEYKDKKKEKPDENEDESGSDSDSDKKKPQIPKRPKDENAPKRPKNGYFFFSNDRRAELKKNPPANKKTSEVSKMIGEEWKTVSEESKKMYEEKAKKAKDEYTKEVEKYHQTKEYKKYERALEDWKSKYGRKKGGSKKGGNKKKRTRRRRRIRIRI